MNRFTLPSRTLRLFLVAACLGGGLRESPAQSVIDWKNNAASTAWATGTNWINDGAPANDLTTNLARFNQTSYVSQPNAGTRSIAGIVIGDGSTATGALTISGTALTIGANGITQFANAGAASLTVTAIVLGANQAWNIASGTTLTATGVSIGGGFALEKTGEGTLLLGGASSFSGGFTLTSGTVRLNGNTAFGDGAVALNGGTISTTGASARTLGNALTLAGNVQFGETGFGNLTFNGLLTVSSGQITLVNNGASLAGGISLNGNLTVDSQMATQLAGNTIGSVIADGSSAFGLIKTGSGVLLLANANTYSGGTTINTGQLWAGSTTALGTGTVTFGGGTLDLRGQNLIVNALAGSTGTITDSNSAGTRILTVGQGDGSGIYGGVISQTGGSTKIVAITKTGSGTQTLTGSNTYLGQTIVSQGTLLINGTHVDASATVSAVNGYGSTSTGHFQVASGANLGGTGRIQGNSSLANSNLVLIESGGFLAPGDGVGTLILDGASFSGTSSRVLNLASGALLKFELAGDGSSADQVQFWNYASGDVLLNGNAINLTLNGTLVAGTYTVDLFRFYSNSGTTLMASGISSGLVVGTLGAGIQSANLAFNANTISLTYIVIPEPSSALLFGLGAFMIWRCRRRILSAK